MVDRVVIIAIHMFADAFLGVDIRGPSACALPHEKCPLAQWTNGLPCCLLDMGVLGYSS